MSKSTLKLAEEISDEFLGSGVTSGKIWVNYNDLGYDKALESLKKAEGLTKFAYEEERIEEILKRVIEKNRAILIELIKQENQLVKEEKEATLAVQNLKKYREDLLKMAKEEKRMHKEPLQKFLLQVNIIKNLLKKDAQIEQALSVVASDLASLISILPKGDE
ncbi:MAG: hypothetical protein QT08_C0014G0010 [archaeon GW2011_AR17]|nr:MAG: hypothetical protein QT08_C0014G0010 [archaeon GW2011_AR17]MBS3154585.1 hypothetical protein [Candidatus Woesearchaeota archaeon]HIH14905.1 hypothetical protein [Nanoarchaeota archaeon]HIH58957.1 hypothetical protein [Nanoarchaeota archaeon]HII14216.1 hypothetical protein [Nanoarchaeota archaeon]